MARELGFEPRKSVLETEVLPIKTIPEGGRVLLQYNTKVLSSVTIMISSILIVLTLYHYFSSLSTLLALFFNILFIFSIVKSSNSIPIVVLLSNFT